MEEKATSATFKKETVQRLMSLHFKDEKTKVSNDALILISELLKLFIMEAAARSAKQAKTEENELVSIDHFEKILPQLLLDF
ncbi:centromere protein X [Erpetoichthys calabaricus]|uniref:Centromere protein X n=1 Tax=Erpetoichthys calabaricus TaxID=27687 RepID=A0A8C4SN64_ERPCA|nr:centromere protein X [Erpetoichthys calabaricus]